MPFEHMATNPDREEETPPCRPLSAISDSSYSTAF